MTMSFNKNTNEAFEALKQYLVQNHNAKVASGGKEIIKRCHICGDSMNKSSAHMYIGMNSSGLIVYNCFKCNAKGIVDGKFLRDMNCYDSNIAMLCQEQNKLSASSNSSYLGSITNRNNAKESLFPYCTNDFAKKKIEYISRRLSIPVDKSTVDRFKIVINLKEFLNFNNITSYSRNEDLVDLLDKYFIGFLSADNRYVILRRLIPEGKLPKFIDSRYVNYNIFGNDYGMKFYTIPNTIDTLKPISMYISEGIFDIISIYNLVERNGISTDNSIFASVNGKTYISLIKHFITTYGFTNFTLHIYPDLDIPDYEMISIKKELSIFNIKIFVHRNSYPGEKDYGISPNRIIDNCTRI